MHVQKNCHGSSGSSEEQDGANPPLGEGMLLKPLSCLRLLGNPGSP